MRSLLEVTDSSRRRRSWDWNPVWPEKGHAHGTGSPPMVSRNYAHGKSLPACGALSTPSLWTESGGWGLLSWEASLRVPPTLRETCLKFQSLLCNQFPM